jgi:hypothetical protein
MLCEPTVRPEVVYTAWPLEGNATLPNVAAPSKNATVPVGVPLPGGVTVTVAVNVTESPKFEGFGDEVSAVVAAD